MCYAPIKNIASRLIRISGTLIVKIILCYKGCVFLGKLKKKKLDFSFTGSPILCSLESGLALRVLVSESVVRSLQPLQDSLLANEDVPVVLQALLHLLPLPLLLLDVVQQGLQAGGDLSWNSQNSF
jgi:hypothetical protein